MRSKQCFVLESFHTSYLSFRRYAFLEVIDLPLLDVLVVLRERRGEDVRAVVAADEVEIVHRRRTEHSFEG